MRWVSRRDGSQKEPGGDAPPGASSDESTTPLVEGEGEGRDPGLEDLSPEALGGDLSSPAETPEPQPDAGAAGGQLAAEYLDQLQRLKAEFDNYRRRVTREREEWFLAARLDMVRQLLPLLDDYLRAKEHVSGPEGSSETAGLLMILKRFEDILTQLGLEKQEIRGGQEFDPEQHEAVMTRPSGEIPEGGILQTVEPGYLYQGRLLRPSRVLVSSGPAPE
jgi:molecular chaperone GrpE